MWQTLMPMVQKKFKLIALEAELAEELKDWKMAFTVAYRQEMTFTKMIRGMLDSLEDSDPAVVEEYEKIVEQKNKL